MEFFFKRLEKYIDVRPSTAMTDIIVKIMVEVLSILGIVTKEVKQGRTSTSFIANLFLKTDLSAERYLKKLVGRKDVENALQRLDKLTQEEARMAAVEALIITRGIDDKVQVVDHKVGSVIQGESLASPGSESVLSVCSVRCQGSGQSSQQPKLFVIL
jgi:hypothetical protein